MIPYRATYLEGERPASIRFEAPTPAAAVAFANLWEAVMERPVLTLKEEKHHAQKNGV